MFKNSSKLKTVSLKTPLIKIPVEIMQKISYFVDSVDKECQWYHTVKSEETEDELIYYLDDFYIPPQEVTGATVETTGEAMATLSNEIKEIAGGYNDKFNEITQSLRCWCHSHVNMGTSPSHTDDKQFQSQIESHFEQNADKPQIMLIFNKSGSFFSRIYEPRYMAIFENVEIQPKIDGDYSYIDEAIKTKIKNKVINNKTSFYKGAGKENVYQNFLAMKQEIDSSCESVDPNDFLEVSVSKTKKFNNFNKRYIKKTLGFLYKLSRGLISVKGSNSDVAKLGAIKNIIKNLEEKNILITKLDYFIFRMLISPNKKEIDKNISSYESASHLFEFVREDETVDKEKFNLIYAINKNIKYLSANPDFFIECIESIFSIISFIYDEEFEAAKKEILKIANNDSNSKEVFAG